MIKGYNQYKDDFFNKLDYHFVKGKKLLDVGCGTATDAEIFVKEYGLKLFGIDVYEDENLRNVPITFKKGSIYKIPFQENMFDYVFVHDVLHHVDEPKHRETVHKKALRELKRVCRKNGVIIIVEGNRFNPLFYPHMVKMRKHEHFRQDYLIRLIKDEFPKEKVTFKFFEAHFYPKKLLPLFKIYEFLMEHAVPKQFIAYNAAIITLQ